MNVHLSGTPTLETDRLILRAPESRDYPAWEAFYLSERARFIGGGPDHDSGKAWRTHASVIGHWVLHGFGMFAVLRRDTGRAIGGCGPWFPALWPEREIGWSVWDPASEGQGFMAEAAATVLRHAFGVLGWTTAVSYVDPANARSIALAERLGAALDTRADAPGNSLVYRHPAPGSE